MVEYVSHAWDVKAEIPASDGWDELLEGAGLRDIVVRTYRFNGLSEYINGIRRLGFRDLPRMLYRFLYLYIVNPAFRGYTKERLASLPPKNLFEYLGYGVYVGRK